MPPTCSSTPCIVAGWKLSTLKRTVYKPAGKPRIKYTPFTSLTALRSPCRVGAVTLMVTPGNVKPSPDWMVPVMVSVWVPCGVTLAAVTNVIKTAANNVQRMTKLLFYGLESAHSLRQQVGFGTRKNDAKQGCVDRGDDFLNELCH